MITNKTAMIAEAKRQTDPEYLKIADHRLASSKSHAQRSALRDINALDEKELSSSKRRADPAQLQLTEAK